MDSGVEARPNLAVRGAGIMKFLHLGGDRGFSVALRADGGEACGRAFVLAELRAQELHVPADQIQRRADFMCELRGGLAGGGEALQFRQTARRAP